MNNYYINFLKFASETFNSKLETKAFFTIALKSSAFIIIMTISLIGFFALLSSISVSSLMELKNSSAEELKLLVPYFMIMYFFFILIIFIVNSYYYVKTREYILGNTRLNSIEFSSKMSFRKLTFIMLTNLLFIILTLGFYTPWAKVRVTKYILECTYITSNDLTVYIDTAHEKQSAFGDELADAFDVDLGLAI